MNIFHSLGDAYSRLSAWAGAVWDAATGKRLTQFERLNTMSIFARLEALEARVTAVEAKPDVDPAALGLDALTARVTTLEGEVGTPVTPAPAPAPVA